jgi:thiol-disulfide isomerase/thioredoxin
MKIWSLSLSLIFCTISLLGQTADTLSYPEVGKPMPDLTLRNIKYYAKKSARVADFRGKWLLLDFWDIHCTACIGSFPHINEIQAKLGEKVQVMLVGRQDEGNQIEPMYKKFKERMHLALPCSFDSLLVDRLDIAVVPHSILIDDKGIVQFIASSFSVADVEGFLAGTPPRDLPKAYRRMHDTINVSVVKEEHYDFNADKPLLLNANGGKDSDFLFRSILSAWDRSKHRQYTPSTINEDASKGSFQVLGAPLEWLYNYAYFSYGTWGFYDPAHYGKYYLHPVLEVRDSSRFKYSFKYSRNIFSYSLIMPAGTCTEQSMKLALQRELETYSGFEASVETRNCPCWKLVASDKAKEKLKTKAKVRSYKPLGYGTGFTARNYSMGDLLYWITSNQQERVIVDATGIVDNLDITMDCIPTDLNDLQHGLRANGLDLVPAEIPMRVVVIRDKKEVQQAFVR